LVLRRLGRDGTPVPAFSVGKRSWKTRRRIRQAMLAVAQLGGHIKNNGDPGWLVLGRGYEELLVLEEGARAVLEM
jgi:hypothetical protein